MWFQNIFGAKKPPVESKVDKSARQPASIHLSAEAIRQINRLRLNTGQMVLAMSAGARTSRVRRPASDFREHRQYVPGDDVRYVDWKASARQEHIFIKQGEYQKAATIYILLDCSASMAWGQPSKSITALKLAHALGYMALAHGDRLIIIPVGGAQNGSPAGQGPHPLGPLWGKAQVNGLSHYLQSIRFQGRVDLAQALIDLKAQKIVPHTSHRGGLVVVISDLLGIKNLDQGLSAMAGPRWNLVLCHLLHPDEISPALNGYIELQDIETDQKKLYPITPKILLKYQQQLEVWKNEIINACAGYRAGYTLLSTNGSLENELLPQLRKSQVVKRL